MSRFLSNIGIALFLTVLTTGNTSKREEPQLIYQVQEEAQRGTLVSNLIEDARLNYPLDVLHLLRFRFLMDANSMFDISPTTGIITTAAVIDRDSASLCRQKETCEISLDIVIQPSQHFQIIKVIVEILDINDNAPRFRELRITLPINEAAAVGSAYILPTANDIDSPENGVQRYELDSVSDRFGLQMNPKLDGTLEVKLILEGKLDREGESNYQLKLMAFDSGGPSIKNGTLIIDVVVHDSNDNRPEFMSQQYEISIVENLPIGANVLQVLAIDQDAGPNGLVGYSFATQTQSLHGHLFAIRNLTGEIVIRGIVDHEKASVYQLIVIAQDHGPDTLSSEVTVIVHVEDVNDNAPSVTFHTLSSTDSPVAEILEDSAIGTFVAHISVLDLDSGMNGRVNCTINEKIFSLIQKYATEYQIVTATLLDRERTDHYVVTLKCQDGATVSRVTERTLRVTVTDINDNAPSFGQQIYKGSLMENNFVGTSVLQVSASDWDEGENARIEYSLPSDVQLFFHVDRSGIISAHRSIDRETHDSFHFLVLAVDMGSPARTGSALVLIDVDDVNDEKPRFSQSSFIFGVFEDELPGTKIGSLSAIDKDRPPFNNFLFAFMSDAAISEVFMLDPSTGIIKTKKILDRETLGLYQFVVLVYDPEMSAMTDTASVSVNVLDKNDNSPEFIFPSATNNSVQVSSWLPVGHPVVQVSARDADLEDNARLFYKIVDNRNNNGTFKIESNTGTVLVGSRLPVVDFRTYQVTIEAIDHGSPSKSTSNVLYININQSIPFVGSIINPADESSFSFNLIIIIGIASGCSIVIFLLVVAIVVVRQKDKRRHIHKYNCRMEALRMLTTKEAAQVSSSSPEGSPRKKMLNGTKPLMSNDDDSAAELQPWIHKQQGGSCIADTDKDSVHSVEGSVTDSGRGPSEEGEAGHSKHNRERYLPPPPPPPRGAYWLQQQKSNTTTEIAAHPPVVRFKGLSSTPEEVSASDGVSTGDVQTRSPSSLHPEKTLRRPTTTRQPHLNSNAPITTTMPQILLHQNKKMTIQPSSDSSLSQQRFANSRLPLGQQQQPTLDQLSRQRITLDQLSKLDSSPDHFMLRQPTTTSYDRLLMKPDGDCGFGQMTHDRPKIIIGPDVIV